MKIELDNGFVNLIKKYAKLDISVSEKRLEWCIDHLSMPDMSDDHYEFWYDQYTYYSNEVSKYSRSDVSEILATMLCHAYNDKVDELNSLEGVDDD